MVVDADAEKATQYVDGKDVGQVDYPGELNHYDFANIGRQGNETWEGMIDEVIIFSKALSGNDLKVLMGGVKDSFAIDPKVEAPVVWGKFSVLPHFS